MVRVADGERVRERVVERDVLTGEVSHRRSGLGGHPLVVRALVERPMAACPVVVQVLEELQPEIVGRRPERQYLLAEDALLVPDRHSAGQRDRTRVTESAHTLHGAEVVIEGSILLHQYDDVLDVLERARTALRGQ